MDAYISLKKTHNFKKKKACSLTKSFQFKIFFTIGDSSNPNMLDLKRLRHIHNLWHMELLSRLFPVSNLKKVIKMNKTSSNLTLPVKINLSINLRNL